MQFLIPFVSNGKPATLHCLDAGKSFSNRKLQFEVKQTQIPYFKRSGIIKTCPCRFVEGNEVPQTKPGQGPVHITIPNPSFKSHISDPPRERSESASTCLWGDQTCLSQACLPAWLTDCCVGFLSVTRNKNSNNMKRRYSRSCSQCL